MGGSIGDESSLVLRRSSVGHGLAGCALCSQDGFTVIELLAVTAIAAVLLGLAVPGFRELLMSSRMTSRTNEFIASLHLARSEAIKRGSRVTLCKSADGSTCSRRGGWQQGWMVFADPNDNAAVDVGEEVLYVHGALGADDSLVGNRNVADYISYIGDGRTQLVSGAFQAGTLILCDARGFGDAARAIVINRVGRVRSVKATDSGKSGCEP